MASDPGEAPKIIVDSDWKNQAQAEKERLAEAEAAATGRPGAEQGMPVADFPALVSMLITQSLMYLGGVADRRTGQAIFDPDLAKFYIDLLAVLEEKTRGNVSDAESKDLLAAVHELRGRFVELSEMVARQAMTGGAAPAAPSSAGRIHLG